MSNPCTLRAALAALLVAALAAAMTLPARAEGTLPARDAGALSAHDGGVVELSFLKPEKFTDIGHRQADRQATLQSIRAYLVSLGPRLAPGQTLRVQISDVDLAGELRPFRGEEIRVLRGGADWPRIVLHYTLLAHDQVLAQGDADLSDMNYLWGQAMNDPRLGDLPFEKRMLAKWFAGTFAAP